MARPTPRGRKEVKSLLLHIRPLWHLSAFLAGRIAALNIGPYSREASAEPVWGTPEGTPILAAGQKRRPRRSALKSTTLAIKLFEKYKVFLETADGPALLTGSWEVSIARIACGQCHVRSSSKPVFSLGHDAAIPRTDSAQIAA